MKKFCIIFLATIIIILSAVGLSGEGQEGEAEYLRIHIRANSNGAEDQAVKYEVRDELVEYLTPIVAESGSLIEAEKRIQPRLDEVSYVAKETLQKAGYSYGAAAEIKTESFPTRVYSGYELPAGEYRALIVTLGEGEGDNWWCVVYPPLCFTSVSKPIYKSKIVEIIKRWQAGL